MIKTPLPLNEYGRIWLPEWVRPYESLWSIWQRYKQVNALSDNAVYADLSIKNSESVYYFSGDIWIYISRLISNVDLMNLFSIPEDHFDCLQSLMNVSKYQNKKMPLLIPENLIYCPVCMEEHGFHSFLHQINGMNECPWHSGQKLVKSTDLMYRIARSPQYAYGKEKPNDIDAPLPMVSPSLEEIKTFTSPYKNIFAFLNSETSLSPYLFAIHDSFKEIAKTEEEMISGAEAIKEHYICFLAQKLGVDRFQTKEDRISWAKYNLPGYHSTDSRYVVPIYIHEWVCKHLSAFPKSELVKYMNLMDESSQNWNPEILPDKKLIALIRCARAITFVSNFKWIDSIDVILHPRGVLKIPCGLKGINFSYCINITDEMYITLFSRYGRDFDSCALFIHQMIISDYLDTMLKQIEENPYADDLSGIKEPNYLVVQLKNGTWGYYRL